MPPTSQTTNAAARPTREPTANDGLGATVSEHLSAHADDPMGADGAVPRTAAFSPDDQFLMIETLQRELVTAETRTHAAEEALMLRSSACECEIRASKTLQR